MKTFKLFVTAMITTGLHAQSTDVVCGITFPGDTAHPNIVVIEPDDLDRVLLQRALDLGLMPNLAKLQSWGVSFQNYYVSDARGCPTREAYLIGKYWHNLASANHQCSVYYVPDTSTLPVWLQAAGYSNGMFGKYMDGYGYTDLNFDGKINLADATYVPPGWNEWQAITWAGPVLNHNPPPNGSVLIHDNSNMYDYYMSANGLLEQHKELESDYQTDVLAQKVMTWLATAQAPFMAWITPGAPHIETNEPYCPATDALGNCRPKRSGYADAFAWDVRPAEKYKGTVNDIPPQNASFNPISLAGKPLWNSTKVLLNATNIADLTVQWNHRLEALRSIDDLIGDVVQSVAQRGLLSNTIFLFFSDNGWMYGNWRLGGKLAAYEPSIGVPLIVAGSAQIIAQGASSTALLMMNDIPATILDLAGATSPYVLDGTSFKSLLAVPSQSWRQRYLAEHWTAILGAGGIFDLPDYVATRTAATNNAEGNSLYVSYPTTGEEELYDYVLDPWALQNLNTSAGYLRLKLRMKSEAQQLSTCSGQGCHDLEFAQ